MSNISLKVKKEFLSIAGLEERSKGWTHMFAIPASWIADNGGSSDGDTVTVELIDATGQALLDAFVNVKTAFVTDGTLTAALGTSADDDALLASTSIKSAGPARSTSRPAIAGDKYYLKLATQANTGAPSDISAGLIQVFFKIHSL